MGSFPTNRTWVEDGTVMIVCKFFPLFLYGNIMVSISCMALIGLQRAIVGFYPYLASVCCILK